MITIKAQDIYQLKHTTISHNASSKKNHNAYNININQTKNTLVHSMSTLNLKSTDICFESPS